VPIHVYLWVLLQQRGQLSQIPSICKAIHAILESLLQCGTLQSRPWSGDNMRLTCWSFVPCFLAHNTPRNTFQRLDFSRTYTDDDFCPYQRAPLELKLVRHLPNSLADSLEAGPSQLFVQIHTAQYVGSLKKSAFQYFATIYRRHQL
jgi:hypothetical protein